jgi:pimeloyl-ACP methyl ester carboxylesterase
MFPLRTRFAKDIVTEFLPPARKAKRAKVAIICGGFPSGPCGGRRLEFFSKRGYFAFYPRYRGTWESGGTFLKFSPDKDILDIVSQLPKGFKTFGWKTFRVRPTDVHLFASSFGGAAAILASRDPRVTKVVACSPVVDWQKLKRSRTYDPEMKLDYIRHDFGNAYRISPGGIARLKRGVFFSPAAHAKSIDGKKLFIIHAKDDASVYWKPVAQFAKTVGATLMLKKRGGHFSTSILLKQGVDAKVKAFLRTRI